MKSENNIDFNNISLILNTLKNTQKEENHPFKDLMEWSSSLSYPVADCISFSVV